MQPLDQEEERIDEARFINVLEAHANLVASASSSADDAEFEIEKYENVKRYLTRLGKRMAEDPEDRPIFVKNGFFRMVIRSLASYYPTFERAQAARPSPSGDGDEAAWRTETEKKDDLYHRISIVMMLCMRLLRNVMADNPEAQIEVCQKFDRLLPFFVNITRFHNLNDPDTVPLCCTGVQMLSNLITKNSIVQDEMWPRIVTTDKDEEKLVLKFLSSAHTGTSSAAQVLLINFLRAPDSNGSTYRRCYELCTSPQGLQILHSLLSSSQSILLRIGEQLKNQPEFDAEWQGLEDSLGFIWTIFSVLFDQGYSSLLVSALAPMDAISSSSNPMDEQLITNSQVILLKCIDLWLHAYHLDTRSCWSEGSIGSFAPKLNLDLNANEDAVKGGGLSGLVDHFMRLSAFARGAMARGIAKEATPEENQPQDRRLIAVHAALLLLLECFMSINMSADGWSDGALEEEGEQSFANLSRTLLSEMRGNEAFVEELVALLDQTHKYAPALSPFRPDKEANGTSSNSSAHKGRRPLPQGHAYSSIGKAAQEGKDKQPAYGFDHLKRDIVRVLASLVYAPTGNYRAWGKPSKTFESPLTKTQIRQVQDLVREKGGLFHVLNMTVLDERNPCKCHPLSPLCFVQLDTDNSVFPLNRHARTCHLRTAILARRQSRIAKTGRLTTADTMAKSKRRNAITHGVRLLWI